MYSLSAIYCSKVAATQRFGVTMLNKSVVKIFVNNHLYAMESLCFSVFYSPNGPVLGNDAYVLA